MADIASVQSMSTDSIASVNGVSSSSIAAIQGLNWPTGGGGGGAWRLVAPYPGTTSGSGWIEELVVYNNKLYASVGDDGILWEFNDVDAFVNVADPWSGASPGFKEISCFSIYRGDDYDWNPGYLLAMNYGVGGIGGNCLYWTGSAWDLFVPGSSVTVDGWTQPRVVEGGLVQYDGGSFWSLQAVSLFSRVYMGFYLGDPAAYWSVKATITQERFGCGLAYNGDVYMGSIPRYGLNGGKLYLFTGTGAFQLAPKYGSENYISRLIVYHGAIYAQTQNGYLLVYDSEAHVWNKAADPPPYPYSLGRWCVHDDKIYALDNCASVMYSTGGSWTGGIEPAPDEPNCLSIVSYNGNLYIGGGLGGLYVLDESELPS